MAAPLPLISEAAARPPISGFTDSSNDIKLPQGFDRETAKVFSPLQLGSITLQHRIVHPALGRSRSAHGAETPLAAKYFADRTTPGSLIISQATGVSADSVAWQWAASLHNDAQQSALHHVINAVHSKGGYWFQQLFHVGRGTTPALVKLARDKAGLGRPEYGYRPVSASAIPESGLNTHSGESSGVPHALSTEEIHDIRDNFKKAAQRAIDAGADGIEVLAGNGWLIDQFLHDNINRRTDEYGGSIENRSRFALEVVEAVAEVVGYQRIGIRLSPFSYFHDTDGSQPLDQILHLCHQLILRGIAYLHVGQGRVSRNLTIEENVRRLVRKGIAEEDISLRPFRRLLSNIRPIDPTQPRTALIGNGGYNPTTGLLAVEEGLADAVSFGRCFISNPDLVDRVKHAYPLTPNDVSTFYTHGSNGYTSYNPYSVDSGPTTQESVGFGGLSENEISNLDSGHPIKNRVAIIGAGVAGIASAAALERVGGFVTTIYEQRGVPGGSWSNETRSTGEHRSSYSPNGRIQQADSNFLARTLGTGLKDRSQTSSSYSTLRTDTPYEVLADGSIFQIPVLRDSGSLKAKVDAISAAVGQAAHKFGDQIQYHTTVENVELLPNRILRLRLFTKNPNGPEIRVTQDFDHLIVTTDRTAPFLSSKIRPSVVEDNHIPGLYQHIFDVYNPEHIAFNGIVRGARSWLTWEKSAFLIALLWSGKIHLPLREEQERWETQRVSEVGHKDFHVLKSLPQSVVYFDELNELAAEYLHTESGDDLLLRSFPFRWVLALLLAESRKKETSTEEMGVSKNGSVKTTVVEV